MARYRISDDVAIHFVTMTVVDWLPVFVSEATCRIIAESWNVCHERKGLRIHAYVIMPTHLHVGSDSRRVVNRGANGGAARFLASSPQTCPSPDPAGNWASASRRSITGSIAPASKNSHAREAPGFLATNWRSGFADCNP